jgi:hypothetical protein
MSSRKKLLAKTEKKLNKQQEAFIDALLKNPGKMTEAAITSGYKGKNPRAHASNIWRSPHVRAAYRDALIDKLSVGAGLAVDTLMKLAETSMSERVRLAASEAILDRVGFKAEDDTPDKGVVKVTINLGSIDPGATQHTVTIDQTPEIIDHLPSPAHDDLSYAGSKS